MSDVTTSPLTRARQALDTDREEPSPNMGLDNDYWRAVIEENMGEAQATRDFARESIQKLHDAAPDRYRRREYAAALARIEREEAAAQVQWQVLNDNSDYAEGGDKQRRLDEEAVLFTALDEPTLDAALARVDKFPADFLTNQRIRVNVVKDRIRRFYAAAPHDVRNSGVPNNVIPAKQFKSLPWR